MMGIKLELVENSDGTATVTLPKEVHNDLLKASKIRSRRKRHVNKAVKRMFLDALKKLC